MKAGGGDPDLPTSTTHFWHYYYTFIKVLSYSHPRVCHLAVLRSLPLDNNDQAPYIS